MCHGCSHFFHKAMGIYMGDLTLGANTLYVDAIFTPIAMVGKGLISTHAWLYVCAFDTCINCGIILLHNSLD